MQNPSINPNPVFFESPGPLAAWSREPPAGSLWPGPGLRMPPDATLRRPRGPPTQIIRNPASGAKSYEFLPWDHDFFDFDFGPMVSFWIDFGLILTKIPISSFFVGFVLEFLLLIFFWTYFTAATVAV